MYSQTLQSVVIFILFIITLMMISCAFVALIVFRYQRNQFVHFKGLESLLLDHNGELLQAQLEMQEFAFDNISKEVHDNIGQKLSLAKLLLATMEFDKIPGIDAMVADPLFHIREGIRDLSDLHKSMNSEMILEEGLASGIEFEIYQLKKTRLYGIEFSSSGEAVFLENQLELTMFRIVQECLHNVIKHANATDIFIRLHYDEEMMLLSVEDNGSGFEKNKKRQGAGLANIRDRTSSIDGILTIHSSDTGTTLNFHIPIKPPIYA